MKRISEQADTADEPAPFVDMFEEAVFALNLSAAAVDTWPDAVECAASGDLPVMQQLEQSEQFE